MADAQLAGGLSEMAGGEIIGRPGLKEPAARQFSRITGGEQELATLIRQAAFGDGDALSRLYDEPGGLVYGLALSWMGDQSAAEQVTMEVYEKIYRSGVSVVCGNKKPLAWLLCLTSRQMEACLNRESSREARCGENRTTDNKITLTTISCRAVAFTKALLALTLEERMVVQLACQTSLTLDEIAAGLDWSVERVRTRLGTGMTRLRTELRPPIHQVHDDSPALD